MEVTQLAASIQLRKERNGANSRSLRAYVDRQGLHIVGQDFGPGTASVSPDGEYEWSNTYALKHIPAVVALLDGQPGEDVMTVLQRWTGRADELESRLREAEIPHKFFCY